MEGEGGVGVGALQQYKGVASEVIKFTLINKHTAYSPASSAPAFFTPTLTMCHLSHFF